jgi:hypothetical protein
MDKQKSAWLQIGAYIAGLFVWLWIKDGFLSAAFGTLCAMLGAWAFIAVWARTRSVLIAFVVVAGGAAAVIAVLVTAWNRSLP